MTYTPAKIIPKLNLFQWARPDASNPRLNNPIDLDDTILNFSNPPLDRNNEVIRGDFLMNVRNEEGYTENIFVPSGTIAYDAQTAEFIEEELITGGTSGATGYILSGTDDGNEGVLTLYGVTGTFLNNEIITSDGGSATVNGELTPTVSEDGTTATGVIRGIRLNGLDYITSAPELIAVHGVGSRIGCVISPVHYQILFDFIMGTSDIASGGIDKVFGKGTDDNFTLKHFDGTNIKGFLRKNAVDAKTEFSDDGISWTHLGASGNHGTTAPLKDHGDVANSVSDSPLDGDILTFSTGTSEWTNKTPAEVIGGFLQENISNYAIDASGTDDYVVSYTPNLAAYSDGQSLYFEAGSVTTDGSTFNSNSLGPIPIKKGDYFDTNTGDIPEDGTISGQTKVKTVIFTVAFTGGETSGTLTGNWGYKTGVYSVLFSNGDRKNVTLTKGATTATWTGGLSGAATVNSKAQWFVMHTPSNLLYGGNNSSELHYHDLVRNNSLARRIFTRISDAEIGGFSAINNFGFFQVTTATTNNTIAYIRCLTYNLAASSIVSVHAKRPAFRVAGGFDSATAQEGFIGFVNSSVGGTSLENSIMSLDHFGFIIQDGTLFISCGSGAGQTKIDISATVPSVTAGHIFEAYFDGTTATFYVDNVLIGSINTNVPDNNLTGFYGLVIADASAAAKTINLLTSGWVAYNEA